MTNSEYHADKSAISKSGLDKISISPLHYYEAYLNPHAPTRNETAAMFIGSAIHSATLEPHEFENDYFGINDFEICEAIGGKNPRATKLYKEWIEIEKQKNEGKIMLSASDLETCLYMRDSVHKNSFCREILASGKAEQTIKFTEPITNAPCKIRPDWLSSLGIIADLKSTEDASQQGFAKSCAKFRYHVQDSFYLDGVNNESPEFDDFVFLAVEKKPPFIISVYILDKESKKLGRSEYLKNLETYMECKKTGIWPPYQTGPETLSLPKWAFYKS